MRRYAIIGLLAWAGTTATARTLWVGFDPSTTLRTIQAGLDAAADGDEVVVLDGLYTGPGNRDLDLRGRAITLRSQNGPERCIIDCQGVATDPHRAFFFFNQPLGTTVEGFTVRGGVVVENPAFGFRGIGLGGAVFGLDSLVTLRHCIVAENSAPYGGAVASSASQRGASRLVIEHCTFTRNTAGQGGALYCGELSEQQVINSILWGDTAPEGREIALHNINWGSDVTVQYCDVHGGRLGVWGAGIAGRLVWGDGNLSEDPLFVDPDRAAPGGSGDVGDLHLQSATGRWDPEAGTWRQDPNVSPGIDAGVPAGAWAAETWPNGLRVNLGAFGGTARASRSPDTLSELADPAHPDQDRVRRRSLRLAGDLDGDRAVNLRDFAHLARTWGLVVRPGRADLTGDGLVDARDLVQLSRLRLPVAIEAGRPLPWILTWAVAPHLEGTNGSTMTAGPAFSTDGSGLEYYFEDWENPQFNSGWLSFPTGRAPTWGESDLPFGKTILYRARVRNRGNRLESEWTPSLGVTVPSDDTLAPLPDPAQWDTEPHWVAGTLTIAMSAVEAFDDNGVAYRFECLTDERLSSDWQTAPTYEVTAPAQGAYLFRVRVRDQSSNHNETQPSATAGPDSTAPTPDPLTWAANGRPRLYRSGGGTFNWHTTMTCVAASDPDGGVQYYFQCLEFPGEAGSGFSSGWIDETTYDVKVGQGAYRFRVRARDINGNTTEWSEAVLASL